jgi:hypothetical protein
LGKGAIKKDSHILKLKARETNISGFNSFFDFLSQLLYPDTNRFLNFSTMPGIQLRFVLAEFSGGIWLVRCGEIPLYFPLFQSGKTGKGEF